MTPRPPSDPRGTPRDPAPTILLVDDDAPLRRVIARTLGRRGYRIVECENGAQAIAHLEAAAERVDLIILDLMMPVMDGFATLEALSRFHPPSPVLVVSGGDDGHAPLPPSIPFLAKPFSPSKLLARLEEFLAAKCQLQGSDPIS